MQASENPSKTAHYTIRLWLPLPPELYTNRQVLMEDMYKPRDILGLFMANVSNSRAFVTGADEAAGFQSSERFIAAECTACG